MRYAMLVLLLLTGCSSPLPGFIIAPQVFWPQTNQLQQLEQTLSQALTSQGASLTTNSNVTMTVNINQLQAIVDQRTLEHAVTNQVALTVFIQHPQGTFSKSYSGDSSFTAPFKMDIAAVERELRVLTEQVLAQLLQDSSWHQVVKG